MRRRFFSRGPTTTNSNAHQHRMLYVLFISSLWSGSLVVIMACSCRWKQASAERIIPPGTLSPEWLRWKSSQRPSMLAHAAILPLRGSWAALTDQNSPHVVHSLSSCNLRLAEQAAIGGASCHWWSRLPLAEPRTDYTQSHKQPALVILGVPER